MERKGKKSNPSSLSFFQNVSFRDQIMTQSDLPESYLQLIMKLIIGTKISNTDVVKPQAAQ